LTVPFVFSTTLWTFANATLAEISDWNLFPLPVDLEITASPARFVYRAVAKLWAVVLFTMAVGIAVVWNVALHFVAWRWDWIAPNTSLYPEIDIASKSLTDGKGADKGEEGGILQDYYSILQEEALANAGSRHILRKVLDKRIRVLRLNRSGQKASMLLAGGKDVTYPESSYLGQLVRKTEKY